MEVPTLKASTPKTRSQGGRIQKDANQGDRKLQKLGPTAKHQATSKRKGPKEGTGKKKQRCQHP